MIRPFDPFDGALLVDKPAGPTSHDIVEAVRSHLNLSKVGHCGTLDPAATGLIVLLLGRATKLAEKLIAGFRKSLETSGPELLIALDNPDRARLALLSHRLVGEARNVAAHDLAESAAALEQLARGERTGDVATAYRNLVFQISRITCR